VLPLHRFGGAIERWMEWTASKRTIPILRLFKNVSSCRDTIRRVSRFLTGIASASQTLGTASATG
jgi:hypothetical protein